MRLFTLIRDLFIEFLFPRAERIQALETLSPGELLTTLSQAQIPKEKENMVLFDYRDPHVKEIIWEVKYRGNTKIARKLGEILYDHIQQELVDLKLFDGWKDPILVPVPISDRRRFERGWNQAELVCEAIIACDREKNLKYLPRQLVKVRHTESQTQTKSKRERLENLRNSMEVSDNRPVTGECVIVIDDVTTTGATFAEARRALHKAGARKILCVAIAH